MSNDTILDNIYEKLNDIENKVIVLETKISMISNIAKITIGAVLGLFGVTINGLL